MDAMALLCNLHGDGPATLHRLRAGGLRTIDELRERGADELAGLLGVPPAQARRFVREAQHLVDRLGPDAAVAGLDPEEDDAPTRATSGPEPSLESSLGDFERSVEADRARASANSGAEDSQAGTRGAAPGGRLTPRDRELLDHVLERWRRGAPVVAAASAEPARIETVRPVAAPSVTPHGSSAPARPVRTREVSGTALEHARLDGLGPRQLAGLAEAGVTTLEALIASDTLALGELSGLGFSSIRRLQFIGRRAHEARASSAPRLSVSERPPAPRTATQSRVPEQAKAPTNPAIEDALSPRPARLPQPSLAELLAPTEDEGPGGPFV